MTKKRNNFLRFLNYVRPYWKYVLAGAIGGVVKFTVPLLVPQVTRHLLDNVYLNQAMTTQEKLRELFLYLGGLILVFIFIWAPWTYVRHYFTTKAGQKAVLDLRTELYDRILRMSSSFFERNQSGSIVSRLISDINLAQKLVGSALTNVWMDAAAIIVVLFFMMQINIPVTLVALLTLPVYVYIFKRLRGQIRASTHRMQEEVATMSGNAQEKIAGSVVVHAFTQEKNEGRNFLRDSERLFSSTMRRAYYQSLNMTITGGLTQIAPLIVTLFSGYQVIRGSMTVGELVAISLYLGPLYTPIQRFSDLNVVFANSMAALDRIFDIMDQKPEIRNRPDALKLAHIKGKVEFNRVHFSYTNAPEGEQGPVLQEISAVVEPGQKIALVGPSGSGKSTLVSLIPRFYDVQAGIIRIDDHDVRDINIRSLRRHIGMVLQSPILFSGTVLDNLLYGHPQAGRREVIEACRAANAYGFIQSLPHGFETEIGEGGNFLSGGQRQRLTIARAFLKDPKILILDEATSSLDSESEQLIQEALQQLMIGRTTFIIAHRLSTIVNADKIFVLDNGRIIESGTHTELLRRGGLYQHLYIRQFQSAYASLDTLNGEMVNKVMAN
jgi:ABC-type multidrug transport system fused ATPase/permease subunit